MKVYRKPSKAQAAEADLRYVLLTYANGNVIDPRECPLGNMTPSHWQRIDGTRGGAPNMQCNCKQPIEPRQELIQ